MTSIASHAAGARSHTTEYSVNVRLTENDLRMIRAFVSWNEVSPTRSPKKDQIERGHGEHTFARYERHSTCLRAKTDTTGPTTFKRLVALHVIEHSRNGHCWLTAAGKAVADDLTTTTTP